MPSYMSVGYIQRMPIASKVSVYLTQAFAVEVYGTWFMSPQAWGVLCHALDDNFHRIKSHPHSYLVDVRNLRSKTTRFIDEEIVPNIIEDSAKTIVEQYRKD